MPWAETCAVDQRMRFIGERLLRPVAAVYYVPADATQRTASYPRHTRILPRPHLPGKQKTSLSPFPGQFSDAERKALWKDAGVTCAWRKIDGGYVLEFLVPADRLVPAKMEDGTRIGFNFALDDGGRTVEWFYNYGITGCWHRPNKWAVAKLVK